MLGNGQRKNILGSRLRLIATLFSIFLVILQACDESDNPSTNAGVDIDQGDANVVTEKEELSVEDLVSSMESGEPHPFLYEVVGILNENLTRREIAYLNALDYRSLSPEAIMVDPVFNKAALALNDLWTRYDLESTSATTRQPLCGNNESCQTMLAWLATQWPVAVTAGMCATVLINFGAGVAACIVVVIALMSNAKASRDDSDLPRAYADPNVWERLKVLEDEAADFLLIRAGSFIQGPSPDVLGRSEFEVQREVTISRPFLLQATPVTQGQWKSLIGNNPSYFSECGDDCPVERVNWFEAVMYLNRLSEQEELDSCYTLTGCTGSPGLGCAEGFEDFSCVSDFTCTGAVFKGLGCTGYRLPTEAEWEYAALAGTTGATYGELNEIAWTAENSELRTHPVALKEPNPWGLADMIGNVSEWTGDFWSVTRYSTDSVTDPLGPTMSSEPQGQEIRLLKGCSWGNQSIDCRASRPHTSLQVQNTHGFGFRPARSLLQ